LIIYFGLVLDSGIYVKDKSFTFVFERNLAYIKYNWVTFNIVDNSILMFLNIWIWFSFLCICTFFKFYLSIKIKIKNCTDWTLKEYTTHFLNETINVKILDIQMFQNIPSDAQKRKSDSNLQKH